MESKEANQIVKEYRAFEYVHDDTYYEIYHPKKNSTDNYLREIDGTKTIR